MKVVCGVLLKKLTLVAVFTLALCAVPATAQAQVQQPQALYMISVGVSQYQNPGMNLQSAAKDAVDMAEAFRSQKGKMFGNVEVTTLLNAQATASSIKQAISQLRTKTNPYSYVIVYLAGHGDNTTNGEFFFNAHDFNPFQKDQTSISWRQLQQDLNNMPGKVIVILDSCRSGAVGNGTDLIVLSSALAHQNAGETSQNGYFTQALIEGLSGKADLNHNGIITLAELNLYVSERLEQISFGKQQSATAIPPNVPGTLPLVSLNSTTPAVTVAPTQPIQQMGNQIPMMGLQPSFESSGPLQQQRLFR